MLNIRDGQGFRLPQAIRAVERGGFGMMLLTNTNISMTAYCRNRLGYEVTCLAEQLSSSGGGQGLVGLVTRESTFG